MNPYERILEILDNNNITAKEYSEKIGITKSVISGWKNNKSKPTAEIIAKTCEIFNVSSDYILLGKLSNNNLSSDQQELLDLYSQLDERKKGEVIGYTKALINKE